MARPVQLVDRHPDADRFGALSLGAILALAGLAFATLVVGLTNASGLWSNAILAAGLAPAVLHVARWRAPMRSHRLVYLPNLAPAWHNTVREMSDCANVIRGLVATTPPGPVFDHLSEVCEASTRALMRCVSRAEDAARGTTPDLETIRDAAELRHLVGAAQRLRISQEALLDRPLVELAERTERIRAALEDDQHIAS